MKQLTRKLTLSALVCAFGMTLAQGSLAQEREVIIQGGSPVPYLGYLPVYVAQGAGFFKEEGLKATMNYAANAGMSVQLVAAGNGDISLNTHEPVIQGRGKGLNTTIFATINRSLLYYIAVPPDSNIRSAADLAGKKIGVSNLGSSALPILKSLLDESGVKYTDATFLPVGVGGQALAALRSGQVDALGLWDGIYFAMERGGAKFNYIYHPSLHQFGDLGLAMADKVSAEQSDKICAAGRAIAKATLFIVENPEAVVKMYWAANPAARGTGDEAQAFKDTLGEVQKMAATFGKGTGPDNRFGTYDAKKFEAFVAMLKKQNYINAAPPLAEVASNAMFDCMNKFDAAAVREAARKWK